MAVAYLIGGPADLTKINVGNLTDKYLSVPHFSPIQPVINGTDNPIPQSAVMHYAFYRRVYTDLHTDDVRIYVYDPEFNRVASRMSGAPWWDDRRL